MTLMLIFAGLLLLVGGGELFVRGAVAIATKFNVSPLLIGLTLVGFGTSTPELVTSIQAAFAGSPGIAIGNVIGSNIANIALILGISALIFPVVVNPKTFRRDGTALVLASLLCVYVVLSGHLTRGMGAVLVLTLGGYILFAYRQERSPATTTTAVPTLEGAVDRRRIDKFLMVGVGLAMTILGARLLVNGAIEIAQMLGMSETVIGLTIVAVGTSLPELVTSVIAALRKQADLAFGNIVGSNLYNILGILGVTALIKPINIPAQIASQDIWVMLGATILLIVMSISGWRIRRIEGLILLVLYLAYLAWMVLQT